MNIEKIEPLSDLELYELIVAAYPDTFIEYSEDCIWDEVMQFAEDMFGDLSVLSEFVGRIVLLTMPMTSPISKELSHCLGKVIVKGNQAMMTAVVKRPA